MKPLRVHVGRDEALEQTTYATHARREKESAGKRFAGEQLLLGSNKDYGAFLWMFRCARSLTMPFFPFMSFVPQRNVLLCSIMRKPSPRSRIESGC